MLRRPRIIVVSAGLALAGAITLTACGGGSSSGTAGAAPSGTAGAAAQSAAANGVNARGSAGGRGPAASGTIAEVDGTTMQVQNQQDGQVAVTWTAKTTFTQQAQLALSSLKAGECVTAIAATSGTSSSASSAPAAPLTATTITVTQPVNGDCTGGFGGGGGSRSFPGGSRPSGFPTGARPSGARPSGFPSGSPGRAGFNFGDIASGKVVSVSGSSLVVAARTFSGQANSGSTPATTTTNRTVSITSTTKITTEQKATAAAVKVGRCAAAQGAADSSGTVTAMQVSITDPVNGQCTAGFGRGNFGSRTGTGASAGRNAGGTGA